MATTKISKGKTYNIKITNKSKDTTYVIKDEKTAKKTVLNFTSSNGNLNTIKNGNDLLITTYTGSPYDGNLKVVLTTVKDYFKYELDSLVKIDGSNDLYPVETKGGTISDKNNGGLFYGNQNNTSYKLNKVGYFSGYYASGYFDEVVDIGGNDRYDISARRSYSYSSYSGNYKYESYSGVYTEDYSGDDIYNILNHAYFMGYDYKGNDTYTLNTGTAQIEDFDGNDSYSLSNSYFSNSYNLIADYKGNDNYSIDHATFHIADRAGNDSYDISNSNYNNVSHIEDYSGKDMYSIYDSSYFAIEDGYFAKSKGGNDEYQISSSGSFKIYDGTGSDVYGINEGYDFYILDGIYGKGNDKYTLRSSEDFTINDFEGKESYVLKNCGYGNIYDGYFNGKKASGGNDSYDISKSHEIEIYDYAGKNTYKVTNSTYTQIYSGGYAGTSYYGGNDKYIINSSKSTYIRDYAGKDEYNFTGGSDTVIYDVSGDDKYNFKNVEYSGYGIQDVKGNDKYVIDSVLGMYIKEIEGNDKYDILSSSAYIYDQGGKDTYTIKNCNDLEIVDYGKSKDTYKITSLTGRINIEDDGGKDSLIINSNAKNLIFMADFSGVNYGSGLNSDSLFIIDTETKGILEIEDYFTIAKDSSEKYIVKGKGAGCIETIKAGKKNVTSFASQNTINSLASTVGSWIDNNLSTYGSVSNILNTTKESDLDTFIAAFAKN